MAVGVVGKESVPRRRQAQSRGQVGLACTRRAAKTALLNLSFSRAVRLPFAIILLCDRVETNSINPVSQGKVTGQKPCIHAGLRRFDGHSHSLLGIVFNGFCFINLIPHFFDYLMCPYYPAYTMGCYQIVIGGDNGG